MPINWSSFRASSSVLAVVTIDSGLTLVDRDAIGVELREGRLQLVTIHPCKNEPAIWMKESHRTRSAS